MFDDGIFLASCGGTHDIIKGQSLGATDGVAFVAAKDVVNIGIVVVESDSCRVIASVVVEAEVAVGVTHNAAALRTLDRTADHQATFHCAQVASHYATRIGISFDSAILERHAPDRAVLSNDTEQALEVLAFIDIDAADAVMVAIESAIESMIVVANGSEVVRCAVKYEVIDEEEIPAFVIFASVHAVGKLDEVVGGGNQEGGVPRSRTRTVPVVLVSGDERDIVGDVIGLALCIKSLPTSDFVAVDLAGGVHHPTHKFEVFGVDRIRRQHEVEAVCYCVADARGIRTVAIFNGLINRDGVGGHAKATDALAR